MRIRVFQVPDFFGAKLTKKAAEAAEKRLGQILGGWFYFAAGGENPKTKKRFEICLKKAKAAPLEEIYEGLTKITRSTVLVAMPPNRGVDSGSIRVEYLFEEGRVSNA